MGIEQTGDGPDCSGFWREFDAAYGDVVRDPDLRPAESPYPDLYGAEAYRANPDGYHSIGDGYHAIDAIPSEFSEGAAPVDADGQTTTPDPHDPQYAGLEGMQRLLRETSPDASRINDGGNE